ncbi:MAG: hypothetical protein M3342_15980, partial [Bacteroidota bacterium]|nr:hypothetical protein [Bacteroidota bacterium]
KTFHAVMVCLNLGDKSKFQAVTYLLGAFQTFAADLAMLTFREMVGHDKGGIFGLSGPALRCTAGVNQLYNLYAYEKQFVSLWKDLGIEVLLHEPLVG